jgi:hypothetical protein
MMDFVGEMSSRLLFWRDMHHSYHEFSPLILYGRPRELSPVLIEENTDVDRVCSSGWQSVLSLVIEAVSFRKKEALSRTLSRLCLFTIFTWSSSEMLRKLGNPEGIM